jgi:hypothetical protein
MSTTTLKSSHKPRQWALTMGLMRSSLVRATTYQSTTKFLPDSRWFLGSLPFINNKFGDKTLQESESQEITKSGTGHLPPAPVQLSPVNQAQLRHIVDELGKTGSDPTGNKADHSLAIPAATTDQIYQSSLESDSEGGGEVYVVGNGEELLDKMLEEIQREAEEEITCAARLARDAERGKMHNGLQDNSGASEDEPRDGTPVSRHHPKFNSWRKVDQDQLHNRSRSIHEELGQIEYQGEQVYPSSA